MIQSNGKYRPEKIPYLDTFQAVEMPLKPKAEGRTSKRGYKKTKHAIFYEKRIFLAP